MQYMRTSDKIIEVPQDYTHLKFVQDAKKSTDPRELCDGFMIRDCFDLAVDLDVVKGWAKARHTSIYGVIRTTGTHNEPIIKSVCRMNEDGQVLELY